MLPPVHPSGTTSACLRGATTQGSYTNFAGTRAYWLYRPAVLRKPPPLFVMLHGGSQSAADFALGTRMNEVADECGGLVLYAQQSLWAHPLACWKWYEAGHQSAETGEPALLAGLTGQIIADHGVDPQRVYVAGLSAGGAMAVILGQAYPHLYAAIGVHSGLPTSVAHDLCSALGAMREGPCDTGVQQSSARPVSTIVFHGDCDRTVHPLNGEAVMAQALCGEALRRSSPAPSKGTSRSVTRRTRRRSKHGTGVDGELWIVHGAGHAWSGGDRLGSFTDEKGPDASREMKRFFLKQRLGVPGTLRL